MSNTRSRLAVLASLGCSALFLGLLISDAKAQLGVRVNPGAMTAPLTQSLNAVNSSVSRSLNTMTRSVNRGLGQVNTSVNRSLNAINSYGYRSPYQVRYPSYRATNRPSSLANRSYSMARSSRYSPQTMTQPKVRQSEPLRLTEEQIASLRKHQAAAAKTQVGLGILPPDMLTQLSEKQAGLQNAAQKVAFDAQIGEIIEWDFDGAAGSAQAISEDRFGTMVCREFVQTLTLNGTTETGTAQACQRGNGQWALALN